MEFHFLDSEAGSFFHYTEDLAKDRETAFSVPSANHILWNQSRSEFRFSCDDFTIILPPHSFCTLTALHFTSFPPQNPKITAISFNREFYCIRDHDHEVSCNGILFYGAQSFGTWKIEPQEEAFLKDISQLFLQEFPKKDPMHPEMLVSLLKVLIIALTRIGKKRIPLPDAHYPSLELIRKFNLLVEENFRKKKQIHEYAFLLNVSSKKLTEAFRKAKQGSPLSRIHERVILESKRLMLYSFKSVNEISVELGFENPSQFSKLFKKVTGKTPTEWKPKSSQS